MPSMETSAKPDPPQTEKTIDRPKLFADVVSNNSSGKIENKKQDWIPIKKKTKKSKPLPKKLTILGSNENAKIKGLQRTKYALVTRLEKNTTCEDVISFLKHSNIDAVAFELKTKSGEYRAFKVGTFESSYDKLMDANIWPKFSVVRKYIYRMPTTKTNDSHNKEI